MARVDYTGNPSIALDQIGEANRRDTLWFFNTNFGLLTGDTSADGTYLFLAEAAIGHDFEYDYDDLVGHYGDHATGGLIATVFLSGPSVQDLNVTHYPNIYKIDVSDAPVSFVAYEQATTNQQRMALLLAGADEIYGSENGDFIETFGNVGIDSVYAGLGADTIIARGASKVAMDGEEGNDTLLGGATDDTLIGGDGDDRLTGGAGADEYECGDGDDVIVVRLGEAAPGEFYHGGDGDDRILVEASEDLSGSIFESIEHLHFSPLVMLTPLTIIVDEGISNEEIEFVGSYGVDDLRIVLGANGYADLRGISFADWDEEDSVTILGTTGSEYVSEIAAHAFMDGGAGIDCIDLDYSTETTARLLDIRNSTIARALQNGGTYINFETVNIAFGSGNDAFIGAIGSGDDYTDWVDGGDGDDTLDGGSGRDYLSGGSGADTLYSLAGGGPDQLDGGEGVDLAVVDRSDASLSLRLDVPSLQLGSYHLGDGTMLRWIERLDLKSGSGNDDLTGGALDDTLSGNGGRDMISGGGGGDRLFGGDGVDILTGDAGDDSLDGGADIDTLSGDAGKDTLNGGAGSDNLDGGSGNDSLNGGSGIDIMSGGVGDDTYWVDNRRDAVFEDRNEGTDLVISTISWILDDDVENLTLSGTSSINATGNDLNNSVQGNAAANAIDGDLGRDTLMGGGGKDAFVFSTKFGSTNIDTISDFVHGTDKIQIKSSLVKSIGSSLSSTEFRVVTSGNAAADANDMLIFNKTDGKLWYDSNGKASGGIVQIAVLTGSPDNLSYQDFLIV